MPHPGCWTTKAMPFNERRMEMAGAVTSIEKVGKELNDFCKSRRKNILVVDDEQGILESLEEVFNQRFNVFTAKDGREAIDLLGRLRFNLVTLDLTLPEIEGIDVLKRIRELSEPPPVIVITGHSTHERAKECANSAVLGYVEKPFDPFELLERVTGILKENKDTEKAGTDSELLFTKKLSEIVEKAVRFININYCKMNFCKRPIRPKDVAAHVSVPRKLLGKMFKEETEHTMDDYLNLNRVEKAKELLLRDRDARESEASYKSGFRSVAHFLRVFKRYTGMTPTDFRKSHI